MILGRNAALWLAAGSAVINFIGAWWVVTGGTVDAGLIMSANGLWAAIVAVVANVNTPGSVPTFSRQTKTLQESWRDLRH